MFKKYRNWSCLYQDGNEQWRKHKFSSKYDVCTKSIETEAVFTKMEMNNEGNINFLQNTTCVQKVSKLKLSLPRWKWTMKERWIFFKIRRVFKKYRNWSWLYQDGNEQWRKHKFSSKYDVCSKSIETEAVFTKMEMNNEVNKFSSK